MNKYIKNICLSIFYIIICFLLLVNSVYAQKYNNLQSNKNTVDGIQETCVKIILRDSKDVNNDLLDEVDLDIAKSFGLSLNNFKKIDEETLLENQSDIYSWSLLMCFKKVMETQSYGDRIPTIYIDAKGECCYIFNKKADGINCVYTLKYDKEWKVVKIDKKKGSPISFDIEDQKKLKNYSPLTLSQVESFLADKNVIPLATRNINNCTIILFKNDIIRGSYILSSDQNGRISEKKGYGNNDSDITPIFIGKMRSAGPEGNIQYVEVFINKNERLKEAYSVKVTLDNKTEIRELVNNSEGLIIPLPDDYAGVLNIIILDKDGTVLYNKAF